MKIFRSRILYDYTGKLIVDEKLKRKLRKQPNFPIEHYLNQSLMNYCKNYKEIIAFLKTCSFQADKAQYNINDFWMLPYNFESERKGDCEDFALYTWIQLTNLGFDTRLVIGLMSSGGGHAWCTIRKNRQYWIIDPVRIKQPIIVPPNYSDYRRGYSISFVNGIISYYSHMQLSVKKQKILNLAYVIKMILLLLFLLPILLITFFPIKLFNIIKIYYLNQKYKYL